MIVVSYSSAERAIPCVQPTLVLANPGGTVSNGRRYYCFTGGTGCIVF
jgi:hypothetical protein